MKHYIISEEELIDLLDDNIRNACQSPIDLAKAILEDLPTVEVIASGEIEFHSTDCFYSVGKEITAICSPYTKILKRFANILGQKGKLIWVEEIE